MTKMENLPNLPKAYDIYHKGTYYPVNAEQLKQILNNLNLLWWTKAKLSTPSPVPTNNDFGSDSELSEYTLLIKMNNCYYMRFEKFINQLELQSAVTINSDTRVIVADFCPKPITKVPKVDAAGFTEQMSSLSEAVKKIKDSFGVPDDNKKSPTKEDFIEGLYLNESFTKEQEKLLENVHKAWKKDYQKEIPASTTELPQSINDISVMATNDRFLAKIYFEHKIYTFWTSVPMYKEDVDKATSEWPVKVRNLLEKSIPSLCYYHDYDNAASWSRDKRFEIYVTNPVTNRKEPLASTIMDLNDNRNYSREQIADWLETLDEQPRFELELEIPSSASEATGMETTYKSVETTAYFCDAK